MKIQSSYPGHLCHSTDTYFLSVSRFFFASRFSVILYALYFVLLLMLASVNQVHLTDCYSDSLTLDEQAQVEKLIRFKKNYYPVLMGWDGRKRSMVELSLSTTTQWSIGVGAQSTLGGGEQDIFTRKYMHEKLTKCLNFT